MIADYIRRENREHKSMAYRGSEQYWEGLILPEKYDAARAREIAQRRRRYAFATLLFCVGFLGQGGCWGYGMAEQYSNDYEFGAIVLSGFVGLCALWSGAELWKLAEGTSVREPRIDINDAIAYEEQSLRVLRTKLLGELVPKLQHWFRYTADTAVREQPEVTNVLGSRLTALKNQVDELCDAAKALLERELSRDDLWLDPYSSNWDKAAARIAQQLSLAFERTGYRPIQSKPRFQDTPSWREIKDTVLRLRELRELKARREAERAWREA